MSRPLGRRLGYALAAAVLLAGCGGGGTPVTPLPGGSGPEGSAPTSATTGSAPDEGDLVARREAAGIPACPSAEPVEPRADGLPPVRLDCFDGGPGARLSDLRGRPMLVNVWAQWCGPCRDEAPHLAAYQQVRGDDVMVVGIDYADPLPGRAIDFADSADWDYPHYADQERELAGPLRIAGIPQTLLVDADGRIVHRIAGPVTDLDQLLDLTREHLHVG